jgi:membrane protein
MNAGKWGQLLKDAALGWWEHNAFRFGAALAYYSVVSLAPLMLLVVGVAQLVFGHAHARGHILGEIRSLIGPEGADAVQAVLENARQAESGIVPGILGAVALLIGVMAVVMELQSALNTVWGGTPGGNGEASGSTLKQARSLAVVLAVGFLLLTSLIVSAVLAALTEFLGSRQPGLTVLWHVLNVVLSFAVITLLFALMFKYLPDVRIAWNDLWPGAAVTALLFVVGKYAIGLYLGNSGIASAYGAAGSIVVVLVWVYYSALIFLFGAEITRAYARRFGSGIGKASGAVRAEGDTGGERVRTLPRPQTSAPPR